MRSYLRYGIFAAPLLAMVFLSYVVLRWGTPIFVLVLFSVEFAVLLGLLLGLRTRTNRLLRSRVLLQPQDSLRQRAEDLAQKLGIKRVSVYKIDKRLLRKSGNLGAIQVGILRHSIVISDDLPNDFSIEEQNALILHELAHIRRSHLLKQASLNLAYVFSGISLFLGGGIPGIPDLWASLMLRSGIVLIILDILLISPFMSRQREFEADYLTAMSDGTGENLGKVLTKLDRSGLFMKSSSTPWGRSHPLLVNALKGSETLTRRTSGEGQLGQAARLAFCENTGSFGSFSKFSFEADWTTEAETILFLL